MNHVKKTIYLLNINNYAPNIRFLTRPAIEKWAQKIDADIVDITERKFPEYPIVYEKLQIYELGKENKSDWHIYIDSDAVIHPDLFDMTTVMKKDQVLHVGMDMASNRWKYDEYFLRDTRNIGSCNWFTVASDLCLDLWKPLDDLTLEEALGNIFPVQDEQKVSMKNTHLIDDYVLSRNIAKYGLHFITFPEILKQVGQDNFKYLWHEYLFTEQEKFRQMCYIVRGWNMLNLYPPKLQETIIKIAKEIELLVRKEVTAQ